MGLEPPALARQILEAAGVKGGLVVHVGCGDGRLTAALHAGDSYLVHGLDADPSDVEKAREHIRSLGLYGKVSVDRFRGAALPYGDNLVNLIVAEDLGSVPMTEVLRALCPNGVAYLRQGEQWRKTVKPRPEQMDEWTHFLHGPDNNAVAHDPLVGPPRHIQWQGKPKFLRAHEQLASLSACVAAGGRLFYVIDEAPVADVRLPSKWFLVARDAFSGVVLWTRPVPQWADQLRSFRAGPPDLPFRLVALGGRVYVTLGIAAPVSVLDAATGETLQTCEGTEHARQILRAGDKLVVLVDTQPQAASSVESAIRRGAKPAPGARAIVAADASGRTILWRKEIKAFVHPTLAASNSRLLFQTTDALFCLDLDTGRELWHAPAPMKLDGHEVGWESPTLVAHDKAVYCADFKQVVAFSVDDGKRLWSAPTSAGYNSPPDIMVIGGLLWAKGKGLQRNGYDLLTGTLRKEFTSARGYMHHRCYRNKATDRFLLLGNQGVQFLDVASGEARPNFWIRGTCQYGVLPANGLLYVPPDSCACNLKTKLNGFFALAASRSAARRPGGARLERGPAWSEAGKLGPPSGTGDPWATYRHDPARSGMTRARVPATLAQAWRSALGGRLSAVTVADAKLFVASIDTHTVHALDAASGRKLWSYTAGGRVDSPPTVYRGMALFGSADGWVYALRAADGALVWRFRAAPEDRRVFINGQLESAWPVHGSVLIAGDVLVAAAGRSSYLDGGIRLYRLDPATGKQISATAVYSPDPETGKQPAEGGKEMRGLLSDILVARGEAVYMRHVKLDLDSGSETGTGVHLFTPVGLLDDTWWHRAYWLVHHEFRSHWSGWWRVGNSVPSGRILSYDDASVFGYGRDRYPGGNTGQWRGGEKYHLFACDWPPKSTPKDPAGTAGPQPKGRQRKRRKPPAPSVRYRWTRRVPLFVRAMLVADDVLFIAGPPDVIAAEGPSGEKALVLKNPEEAAAVWGARTKGILWAVSAADGREIAECPLDAPPVFDGMAAAGGKLYLASTDGTVLCMAAR